MSRSWRTFPVLVKANVSQFAWGLATFCFYTHPRVGSVEEIVMGLNYSKLLISGKSSLHRFEHARNIIWPICYSSWQAQTQRLSINVLGLMLQFQDLSCSHGTWSLVWTRMGAGLKNSGLLKRRTSIFMLPFCPSLKVYFLGRYNHSLPQQHFSMCLPYTVYAPAAL